MSTLVSSAGIIFNGGVTMVSTVASTVVNTPILLLFAMLPLVGLGVGLFKRLINVN